MAKKKSKTQKYKKNLKRKQQKNSSYINKAKPKSEVTSSQIPVIKKESNINKELKETKSKSNKTKNKIQEELEKIKRNKTIITLNKNFKNFKETIINKCVKLKKKSTPEETIELPKLNKEYIKNKKIKQSKKNIIKFLSLLKNNIHILFNAIIITAYIILIIGLIRIKTLDNGTIIYISLIVLFLNTVAISYNKYISGKVFTTILVIGMGFAIYRMQYTYDFIRNLNSSIYEYKTYFVVTFDNGLNKSIYNINNKKVGLLKENCTNVERKLDTKLNKVNYIEYENLNKLFTDFYNQEYRAIIVNENQYKYLQNKIQDNRKVKILYEFQANGKK